MLTNIWIIPNNVDGEMNISRITFAIGVLNGSFQTSLTASSVELLHSSFADLSSPPVTASVMGSYCTEDTHKTNGETHYVMCSTHALMWRKMMQYISLQNILCIRTYIWQYKRFNHKNQNYTILVQILLFLALTDISKVLLHALYQVFFRDFHN